MIYRDAKGRFCKKEEVEAMDDPQTDNNIKYCSSRLRIGAKLDLPGFIKAGVDFILEHVKSTDSKTGDYSAATNTGDYSAATNTGDYSAATNTGNYSVASVSGNYSVASVSGNYSAATNTGDYSAAIVTGNCSAAIVTGNCSAASVSGNYSAAIVTCTYSAAIVTGNESFAIATGYQGKVKGALGCWIACAEWAKKDNRIWHPVDFKAVRVDGKKIKADTWYRLKNGKFVEVN